MAATFTRCFVRTRSLSPRRSSACLPNPSSFHMRMYSAPTRQVVCHQLDTLITRMNWMRSPPCSPSIRLSPAAPILLANRRCFHHHHHHHHLLIPQSQRPRALTMSPILLFQDSAPHPWSCPSSPCASQAGTASSPRNLASSQGPQIPPLITLETLIRTVQWGTTTTPCRKWPPSVTRSETSVSACCPPPLTRARLLPAAPTWNHALIIDTTYVIALRENSEKTLSL